MTELPIPPKELQGLGKLIAFGNPDRGIQGTQFYLKPEAVEKYKDHKFSKKTLKEFSLFDGQSAKDQGVDSARLKMITHPGEKKDAQTSLTPPTELRSNPVTGETIPLKNAWGVRMIDDKTQFVDIPIEDLTTEKPKPKPRTPKQPKTPAHIKSNDVHRILVGYADNGDNVGNGEPNPVFIKSHAVPPTPDVIPPTSDVIPPTPDVIPPTSDIIPPTPDVIPPTPDVIPPTPDIIPPTPDVIPPTPDITPPPSPTTEAPKENVVTLVGIQEAFKRRATDFAKEAMEKSRNIVKKFFGERFEERYYQHFHNMLEAAQNPFAKESIAIAQERAKTKYDNEMNGRNGISRTARKTWDRIKEYTFGTTTLERYAVEEISAMQQTGQIREQASFDQEMQEFVKRFEVPFEESDTAIRKQLGEKLEILNPENVEHKPLIDGIKGLIREYRDGTIPDAKILNDRLHTLYETTIAPARKDLLGEAETYASSLAVVAKEMKDRLGHGETLATLDGELEAMQVRLGYGQMGEATEISATSTHKTIEWIKRTTRDLEKRGIISNAIINEFTVGSAVSAVLALKTIPQAAASATARMWIGGGAGAVVTGSISGIREFGRRQGELRRIGAQKETGIKTPENAHQRQWYEPFDFQLRSTKDLIHSMQSPILESNGQMKQTLTIDELRISSANLADAKARSALSQREHNRFGLITLGAVGEQEKNRTALANSMITTENNLKTYLSTHRQEQGVIDLIGPTRTVEQYLDGLTTAQTQILTEGNDVLTNLNDTYIQCALNPLSSYTPEVDVMRRTLGIIGTNELKGTKSGIDALLEEFKTQAAVESARTGIKTGAIGLAFGAITNEAVMDLKHGFGSGAISGLFTHAPETAGAVSPILPLTHTEIMGDQHVLLGDNMHIGTDGNLDIFDGAGHKINDAIPHFADHYHNGVLDEFAKNKLHELGLNASLTTQDVQHAIPGTVTETHGIAQHFQGGETVVDAQGVSHTPEWTLPQGSHLDAVAGDAHTFNLVDSNNAVIASGIHTDATGAITNFSEVQQHLPPGWHVLESTTSIEHTPEVVIDPTSRTVNVYTEWDNRGDWGWTEQHLQGEHIEHLNPAVNTIKNVWQNYENQIQGSNITFDHTIPGLENIHRSIPLVNGEVSANIMPNNSIIELPNSLFSDHNMAQMAKWSDEAIKMLDARELANPDMTPMQILAQIQQEDKLHGLILRIGRFAVPALNQEQVSPEELQFLMRELAGGHTETVASLLHNITFTESITQPMTETIQSHVFTVAEQLAQQGGPEGFIPIIPNEFNSKGLESIETPFKLKLPELGYNDHMRLEELQKWIRNNPDRLHPYKKVQQTDGTTMWLDEYNNQVKRDVDKEKQHIQSYTNELRSSDPTYYTSLESLVNTPTLQPMSENNRVSVMIPAWMEEKIIYGTLEKYVHQKDATGNLLDPDLFEINIIVNRKTGATPDNTVGEIQRFITESQAKGEHYHINYVDVEFKPPFNNVGHARKVITDTTLMRSQQRPTQQASLYIESEDADLENIDPQTIYNIITKLDKEPQLDAVSGIQDRNPDMMMQNDYLFLSQRLDELIGQTLQRSKNYRPENNPNWNSFYNRTITGGWNTAYTAEAYAMIGGGDSRKVQGEDTIIGEKISMCRGNGTNPNLDTIGRVSSRTDSSPRRFIESLITGKNAYGEAFADEDLNKRIRSLSVPELLENIKFYARINETNADMFKGRIGWTYDMLKQYAPNEAVAKEDFNKIMYFAGLKPEDFAFTPDNHVEILHLDNVKNALESYRQRHPNPRQQGERIRWENN